MKISDLDILGLRLIRSGVAPRVAKRLTRELQDHHADALAEDNSVALADEKLGDIDDVVAAVIADPNHQSWSRSAPFCAYVLVPLLSCMALIATAFFLAYVIIEWGSSSPTVRAALDWLLAGVSDWVEIVVAIGVWVCARRSYSPILMPLLGTVFILSIGGWFSMRMIWPLESQDGVGISMSLAFSDGNLVRGLLLAVAAGVAYLSLVLREHSTQLQKS